MHPEIFEFSGEGIQCVYDNQKWVICIKNWKPNNAVDGIKFVEVHFKTDQQFLLLSGNCVLITALEQDGKLDIKLTKLEPMKVYNVPQNTWYNTITQKDTKLVYVQDAGTCAAPDNSIYRDLTDEELQMIRTEAARLLAE